MERFEDYYGDNDLIFWTNSGGESVDGCPSEEYQWYDTLRIKTMSLLYLVEYKSSTGLMVINEFHDQICVRNFCGNKHLMEQWIIIKASELEKKLQTAGMKCTVFAGMNTGFKECGELGVLITYKDADGDIANRADVQETCSTIDAIVHDMDTVRPLKRDLFDDFVCERRDEVEKAVMLFLSAIIGEDESTRDYDGMADLIQKMLQSVRDKLRTHVCVPYWDTDRGERVPCYNTIGCEAKAANCLFHKYLIENGYET